MIHPDIPECFGVLRCVERPTFDGQLHQQHETAVQKKGKGKLEELFASDDMWVVKAAKK